MTSLRDMPACDFFTKEIEALQLQNHFRISIHSAKDLPLMLAPGLSVVALTRGLDPRDALVTKSLPLPPQPVIATSSHRREGIIQALYPDATFVDIRGTIEGRLAKLHTHTIDGVVIALCALMRLNLTHHPHIVLEAETAQFQGQLAVVARTDDEEMRQVFASIDSRTPKTLHTGEFLEIVPLQDGIKELDAVTHLLFTSKNGARLFHAKYSHVTGKQVVAVGTKTKAALEALGYQDILVAEEETSEGIVKLLRTMDLQDAVFFWPHSKKSRRVIPDFFQEQGITLIESVLYDTVTKKITPPSLHDMDEIFFTSPSTIDAFLEYYGRIPQDKRLSCQGPITASYLKLHTI